MADALGSLFVSIRASANEFSGDIKAIQREAKALEKSFKPIQDQTKNIGIALTAAGGSVITAMGGMVKASVAYGSQLNKVNIQTGIATEQLSKLQFAAEQSETSFEGVAVGLKFLARNAAEAAAGSKAQAAAFKDIGVSVKDSSGALRPMNDLLLDVADQFKGMQNETEKAALAQKIFGRSGLDLIPILNEGRAGILRMGNEAERLGVVMSGDAAKAADEFDDTLTQIKAATLGLANAISQALLPTLTSLAAGLRDGIADIGSFAKEHENLTLAIGGTAAAITAAGGLALGLALLGTVLPKVAVGLKAVEVALVATKAAILSTAGALSILKGISLAELPIALKLIGEASIAANIAVAGLGAAIGFGIGSLVNWAIAGTAAEKVLDSVTAAIWRQVKAQFGLRDAGGNGQDRLQKATQRLSDSLAEQGIIVLRGADSLAEWNKRVIDAAKSTAAFKTALQSTAKLSAEIVEMRDFFESRSTGKLPGIDAGAAGALLKENFEKSEEAAKKAEEATKEYRKAVDDLKASITATSAQDKVMIAGIKELIQAGIPLEAILAKSGDAVRKFADEQVALGKGIDQSLLPLLAMMHAQEEDKVLTEAITKATEEYNKWMESVANTRADVTIAESRYREVMAPLLALTLDGVVANRQYATSISDIADQAERVAGIMERNPSILKVPQLPGGAAQTPPPISAPGSSNGLPSGDWKTWETTGKNAINSIVNDISKMFTDMIGHGKSFWEAFKGLGKSAIAAIADTFITTMAHSFLDPLSEQFGKLLDGLQSSIKDWAKSIGGFIKSNISTITLAAGGAALGGAVAGKRGAVAGAAAGIAVGEAMKGDLIGAAVAGAVAAVAALSKSIIEFGQKHKAVFIALTGGVGAAILLLNSLHKQADKFIKDVQAPMGDAVASLFSALTQAKDMGTLTVTQVIAARASFEDLWTAFQKNAEGAGVVGQQALATMSQFLPQWREWLDGLQEAAVVLERAAKAQPFINKLFAGLEDATGLNDAITLLQQSGTSATQIIHFLGGDITSMVETMKVLGASIPPAIQAMYDIIQATGDLATGLSNSEKDIRAIMDRFRTATAGAQPLADAVQRLRDEGVAASSIIRIFGDEIQNMVKLMLDLGQEVPPAIAYFYDLMNAMDETSKAGEGLADALDAVAEIMNRVKAASAGAGALTEAIDRLQAEGFSTSSIIAILGSDIKSMTEVMLALGQTVPTSIARLYDLANAIEELGLINAGITDTFLQLADALNQRADQIDSQMAESLRSIEDWQKQLQSVANERKALEGKIKDATNKSEQDRLQKIIDTTSDIGTYYKTQKELADLTQRIKDEQAAEDKNSIAAMQAELATNLAVRDSLLANIAAEQQRIESLKRDQLIIADLMAAAGVARTNEADAISDSINALMYRGLLLEEERNRLLGLTGAAESANHVFAELADRLARFSIEETAPPQVWAGLPQFAIGGDVPFTGPAILHRGEGVLESSVNEAVKKMLAQNDRGGGQTINVTINAPVTGTQENIRYLAREIGKEVRNGGARPPIPAGRSRR